MTTINFRSAALAIVALGAGLSAAPAFAQAPFVAASDDGFARSRPLVEGEGDAVPPNTMGPFTCAFNERHTHLERQNCGGQHYRYGF